MCFHVDMISRCRNSCESYVLAVGKHQSLQNLCEASTLVAASREAPQALVTVV